MTYIKVDMSNEDLSIQINCFVLRCDSVLFNSYYRLGIRISFIKEIL
jgi:hypothetical protein